MYVIMESENDVIVSLKENVESNKLAGFVAVGERKTLRGAELFAEKRCSK